MTVITRSLFLKRTSNIALIVSLGGVSSLVSCVVPPAAASTFLFELVFGSVSELLITCTFRAIGMEAATAETVAFIFSAIQDGQTEGQKGKFKWSLKKAGAQQLLHLSTNEIKDALLATHQISTDQNCSLDGKYFAYQGGIGSYPYYSTIQICDGQFCYPIQVNDYELAALEILVRVGYRVPNDNAYYQLFSNQEWHNKIPSDYHVYSIEEAIEKLGEYEKGNYYCLLSSISGSEAEEVAIDSTETGGDWYQNDAQIKLNEQSEGNTTIGTIYSQQNSSLYSNQNSATQSVSNNESERERRINEKLNDPKYWKKTNGKLRRDKLRRDLMKEDREYYDRYFDNK